MMKKRFENIDVLRGIAAISVLLGHAIQRGMIVGYDNNLIFKLIYTFHMPLFILLSGYTLFLSSKKYDKDFLFQKIKRLLLPTIVWSYLIWMFRDFSFVGIKPFVFFPDSILEYTKTLILHPNYLIWFLYILFIYNIIFYIGKKLPKDFFFPFLIVVYILFTVLPQEYFGINQLNQYFPFFIIGYYLGTKNIMENFKYKYLWIPSLIFSILYFGDWNYTYTDKLYYYLMAFSNMILIYQIINLKILTNINKVFSWLGKYSLELYLVQCLFLNIGIGFGYTKIITIFISALLISIFISYYTNKNKITKFLLYGK